MPVTSASSSSAWPKMSSQSPSTHSLLKASNILFRVYLASENAFPIDVEVGARAEACFKKACQDLNLPNLWKRYKNDGKYSGAMKKIVCKDLLIAGDDPFIT
jgi:hypothetical protein